MDIQFILELYSCATYVVEYVNKTNRGLSTLHRDLIKLRDEYPDKDYTDLLKELGIKMLNSIEMSSQEVAWYLLNLHMSESSCQAAYIPTVWPHERQHVRKSNVIEQHEKHLEYMNRISLAQFVAWYLDFSLYKVLGLKKFQVLFSNLVYLRLGKNAIPNFFPP